MENFSKLLKTIASLFGVGAVRRVEKGNVALLKQTFSIGDKIRAAASESVQDWAYVKKVSDDYCRALDMKGKGKEIKNMEDLDLCIAVKLPSGMEIFLVPKNTCGCPYGDGWVYLLQARYRDRNIPGIGAGTTFIAALPSELHQEVLDAIKDGHTEIRKIHIWP